MTDMIATAPETRRRRKAERPKEILEAAFAEFSRSGYAATTLDQVAERAGVTKGTIYVYFESKEHLFISMVREATKAALDTLRRANGMDGVFIFSDDGPVVIAWAKEPRSGGRIQKWAVDWRLETGADAEA